MFLETFVHVDIMTSDFFSKILYQFSFLFSEIENRNHVCSNSGLKMGHWTEEEKNKIEDQLCWYISHIQRQHMGM